MPTDPLSSVARQRTAAAGAVHRHAPLAPAAADRHADRISPRKQHALAIFRGLPRRYDQVTPVMSLGQDPRWRRAVVAAVAPTPADRVLDVATGTGLIAAELVRRGGCSVVALDQSAEMLSAARVRFAAAPALGDRVQLLEGEAERLPFDDRSFDALTFAYLLRYVDDPQATMRELTRVLVPGGRIAGFELGLPARAPLRAGWRLYSSLAMPIVGRVVSREWAAAGRFLGPSVSDFYARHPLPRLVEYWREAGLRDVRVRRMSFGAGVVISARKSGADAGRV